MGIPVFLIGNKSDLEDKIQVSQEEATKKATDDASFIKQLKKTGDTPFEVGNIDIYNDNQSFVYVSAINELRRQAIEELLNELCPPSL